ncbi:lantibiotic dehydratase [Streptomyces coffeae]|uniref:Lantibiotic dehydratase n=1 Tax=Streptomyces coffeae TaxID=621382 RepID=A0ABS1NP01_9ACTN|nr:lantibiotic dehydratase [Streptomyces coffeae]MBL1101808.1 lantibiotic dehydratase [Streptomyces coffeae]
MRRLFDSHPVAMARIPLRPYLDPAADSGGGLLEEGVFLASRSAEQALVEGTERGRATRCAYDLRSRTRTTPHGVFAGVAAAALTAPAPTMRLGSAHRAVTTLSPAWLTTMADRLLHEEPDLLPALTLTAASLAARRGDRLEIEHPAPDGARLASVRATEVSRWLLDASRDGVPAADLLAGLCRRHPGADPQKATRALLDMIDTGLLLTDLLPADLRADPLHHLLDKLPATATARPALARLDHLLTRCDAHPPGTAQRRKLLEEARELADTLHHTSRPLAVDTLAEAKITLPSTVGEQAAEAASLLWRIGHRTGPLTDYHRRFCAAYGRQRLVPLLEVLDPVTGLGPPRPDDAIGTEEEPDAHRTAALARLLADALSDGKDELVLHEQHIDQLANPSPLPPPRTAEIHIQLLRDAGGLRIAVCPGTGSQNAGAAPGRWIRWLPHLAPREEADPGSGPMVAEIVCHPRTAAAGALAAETGATPWRIPLDVPARPGDLLPDELAVTTTGTHLQLWSTRHHRPVLPVLHNRLAPRLLPPAAYALHLLGHAGTRPWHPWNWSPLDCWPYTPRVRYRDILLTPARWRLPHILTATASHRATFETSLVAWRTLTRPTPPPVLVAEETDRRLPLDLRQAEQRELLRRSIHRGVRTLAEPLAAPEELAVVDGPNRTRHLIDLVVPLTRRHTPPHTPPDPRYALRAPDGAGTHLPGSSWLSAALATPAHLHNTVLAELARLLTNLPEEIDRWFWLRYTTPVLGPHLRLRFHASPHTLATRIQPQLADLTNRLHHRGLLGPGALHLEPYEQEIERYGGPQAITAVEELFCADSRLALAALARTENERLLIAAAGAAEIARILSPDHLHPALGPGRLTRDQRRHRDALRPQLADDPTALIPADLAAIHTERHAALITYRDAVPQQSAARCASDVIHMHANRMLAVGPGHERIMRTLAADLLHRP